MPLLAIKETMTRPRDIETVSFLKEILGKS